MIFLHGSGERGTDIEVVKKNGPPKIIAAASGIAVHPGLAATRDGSEDNRWDTAKLDALLADLRKTYRVDPSRIYLTGLSLGGYGTWDWAFKRPDLFAAIVPVAGEQREQDGRSVRAQGHADLGVPRRPGRCRRSAAGLRDRQGGRCLQGQRRARG